MRQGNVLIIEDFMQCELKLRGAALFVYAIIYSFCKSCGSFYASVEYLSERTAVSRRTVYTALAALIKSGNIVKLGKHRIYGTVEYGVPLLSENADNRKERETETGKSDVKAEMAETVAKVETAEKVEKVHETVLGARGDTAERGVTAEEKRTYADMRAAGKPRRNDGYFDDIPWLSPHKSHGYSNIPDDYDRFAYYYSNRFETYGMYNLVLLTYDQYTSLVDWLGEDTAEGYIGRLERMMLEKPAFRSFSHFKTIKKWIMEDMRV